MQATDLVNVNIEQWILQLDSYLTYQQTERNTQNLKTNSNTNTNLYISFFYYYETMVEIVFYGRETETTPTLSAVLISLVAHTRDIIAGKGEYAAYYYLLGNLCKVMDKHENTVSKNKTQEMFSLITKLIRSSVTLEGCTHPYGSWKDMKYLLNHLREIYGESVLIKKEVFKFIMNMITEQLMIDISSPTPTLLAKWAPREKSLKFGWQAKYLASHLHAAERNEGHEIETKRSKTAMNKVLSHYRKTVVTINNKLKTPQINQCSGDWSSIVFDSHVSNLTKRKQDMAFKYVLKSGTIRGDDDDRKKCRENYYNHIQTNASKNLARWREKMDRIITCESEHSHMVETNNGSPFGDWNETINMLQNPRYMWIWNELAQQV